MIYENAKIIGDNLEAEEPFEISDFAFINTTGGVEMSRETAIHSFSAVVGDGGLTMQRGACIAYGCSILTSCPTTDSRMSTRAEFGTDSRSERVLMCRESFVGSNATLMPGATLHEGAVVASGAFVGAGEEVPAWTMLYPDGSTGPRDREAVERR